MPLLDEIRLNLGARLPMVLQSEASECGLACLAMVSSFHGSRHELSSLRRRFLISLKGTTLTHLIDIADSLGLAARPLQASLSELSQLKTPCILYWGFTHFVVLKAVRRGTLVIHDPAHGVRRVSLKEASGFFTGVALELWPKPDFRPRKKELRLRLRDLMGRVVGLKQSIGQIVVLALALELFAILSPQFLQWIIDNVIASADRDLLATLVIGFALLLVVQAIVGAARSWVLMHVSTTLNLQWRSNVFRHLLRLPTGYFEKRHLGDIVSRFGAIDQLQSGLTTSSIEAVLDGVMAIVTLTVMYLYNATLSYIALGATLLYALVRWIWYRSLLNATSSQIVFAAKQQTHFLESMRGIRTIKLFQRENLRHGTWLSVVVDQINAGLRTQKLQIAYTLVHGLLTGIENVMILWLGARLVMDGGFTVGALIAFNSYHGQFSGRISNLIDKLFQLRLLRLYGERLSDIVLAEAEPAQDALAAERGETVDASIRISNLRFRYGDSEPEVLRGIDLEIAPGESVALTGESGCGKTTLLHIIMGSRRAQSGELWLGGMNVQHGGGHMLRGMIGTVLQDDVLFAGTISDNISFFDLNPEREWIEECARMAQIHADIMSMPMGYNSLIGDMGTMLSGGQKQRLLLARAFYKRPKILLMDEATSHLDVECEKRILEAVASMAMTKLTVAHRPETIATADRCVTLANGCITSDVRRRARVPAVAISKVAPVGPAYLEPRLLA